jgi:hypothetical protein
MILFWRASRWPSGSGGRKVESLASRQSPLRAGQIPPARLASSRPAPLVSHPLRADTSNDLRWPPNLIVADDDAQPPSEMLPCPQLGEEGL